MKTKISTAQIQQWFGGALPQMLNAADIARLAPGQPEAQPDGYQWVQDYYLGDIRCTGWLRNDLASLLGSGVTQ